MTCDLSESRPTSASFYMSDYRTAPWTAPSWLPGPGNCRNFFLWFRLAMESALDGPQGRIHEDDGEPRVPALVLAYEFQGLLDAGVVNTRAEIAGRYGFSRARVTQIMNLLTLPDEVQACLTSLPPEQQSLYPERRLREFVGLPSQQDRLRAFEGIREVVQQTDGDV